MDNQSKNRLEAFEEAAKPMINFLAEYGFSHSLVVIDQTSAKLFEGQLGVPFEFRD